MGSSKVIFVKISQSFINSHLKFWLITDFSPQVMACMSLHSFSFCSYVVCGWSEAEEDVSMSILWKNFYEAVKYNKTRENTYWRETL